jgi:signal transduction histidine kinase
VSAVYVNAEHTAFFVVSMAAHLGAAMLAMTTGAILLRDAVQTDQQRREELNRRLEEVEAAERLDRERMHEIGSVVAGIASASRLVRRAEVERGRARQLEDMLDAEMARLERLIEEKPLAAPERFDLDGVLGPLVTAQRAQGRQVHWEPSGLKVVVSPDVLAEAVSVLLENAARHAPGAAVVVTVTDADDRLQVVVADRGPGVPETMRDRLFDWEARGPESPGQGIGLNIARRLLQESGGDLQYRSDNGIGATFVVSLPADATAMTSHEASGQSDQTGPSTS